MPPMPEHPLLVLITAIALLIWLAEWLITGWFVQIAVSWLWPKTAQRLPADWGPWLALVIGLFMVFRP
jgi:hypothetical protein